ncbi:MAG: HAD hydrolase-like protein [Planctomycetales bacterium]|nr:HAD hydrolase-like protein [Planctomycetales bacterium]
MKPRRAIVFDLDDTLYLERQFAYSGYRAVSRFLGEQHRWSTQLARKFEHDCRRQFRWGDRRRLFNEVLEKWNLSGDVVTAACIRIYREHAPRIVLLTDARQILSELSARPDVWLALITDGDAATQANKVQALGVAEYFHQIIYTDQWGREFWKPHPRAFEAVEQESGCRGDECVYLGDNPHKDFTAPALRDWRLVRVRRRRSLHYHAANPPELVITSELPNLVGLSDQLGLASC